MTDYYLITLDEIGEIIDITEDSMIDDYKDHMMELAQKRINLINRIKLRKYIEKYKEEEHVIQWVSNPEDFRYCDQEPPDYKHCPCWISPCDPDETRGNCAGGGDCKLWHHPIYEECNRFAIGCSDCDEILCKFRKVIT